MRRPRYEENPNMARKPQSLEHPWRPPSPQPSVKDSRIYIIEAYYPTGQWVKMAEFSNEAKAMARSMRLRCELPYPVRRIVQRAALV